MHALMLWRPHHWIVVTGAILMVGAFILLVGPATGTMDSDTAIAPGTITGPNLAIAQPTPALPKVGRIGCDAWGTDTTAQSTIHAVVAIYVRGARRLLNAYVGHDYLHGCTFWVHAGGDASHGVITIDSPHPIHPTLATWNRIAAFTTGSYAEIQLAPKPGEQQRVYVDRRGYRGDVARLTLRNRMAITIEYGPPWVRPDSFNFTSTRLPAPSP